MHEWISIPDLCNILGVGRKTIVTYLGRAEFNKYIKCSANNRILERFYKCNESMTMLYNLLTRKKASRKKELNYGKYEHIIRKNYGN